MSLPRLLRRCALLGATACASVPARQVAAGEQFEARAGDTLRIAGSGMTFAIVSIADSRCPVDVRCIRAGDVIVALQFIGDAGAHADTLRLATEPHGVVYGPYRVELLDVQPPPRSTDQHQAPVTVLRIRGAP